MHKDMTWEKEFYTVPSGLQRLSATICHAAGFFGFIVIIPMLVALFAAKNKKSFVYSHAVQAIEFQLNMITCVVCAVLFGVVAIIGSFAFIHVISLVSAVYNIAVVTISTVAIIALFLIACSCIACIHAIAGNEYSYPFCKKPKERDESISNIDKELN